MGFEDREMWKVLSMMIGSCSFLIWLIAIVMISQGRVCSPVDGQLISPIALYLTILLFNSKDRPTRRIGQIPYSSAILAAVGIPPEERPKSPLCVAESR